MRWGATSRAKYKNRRVQYQGEWFDSQRELDRYLELKLLEKAGEITALRRQVKYVLVPAQYEPDTIGPRGGVHKGKLIERELAYVADFVYERDGQEVVEDVKSPITEGLASFSIKKKLMLHFHGIRVQIVK